VIWSCLGCGLSLIVFGFSFSYLFAFCIRLLNGALSGNTVVISSHIASLTNKENRSRIISILSVGWAIGSIIGPAVSGLLSFPRSKYPTIQWTILRSFPYIIPCIIAGVLYFITAATVFFLMSDMEQKANTTNDDTEQLEHILEERQEEEIVEAEETIEEPIDNKVVQTTHMTNDLQAYFSLFKSRKVVTILAIYFICYSCEVFTEETFPLFSLVSIQDGGIEFTTRKIGIVQLINGLLFLIIPFSYEFAEKKIGHLNCNRLGLLVTCLYVLVPFLNYIAPKPVALWAALVCYSVTNVFTITYRFTSATILTMNSVPSNVYGKLMATTTATGSLSRFIIPNIAGPMIAFFINQANEKNNHLYIHIHYVVLIFICLTGVAIGFTLDNSVNNQQT
jgi:MFS family permease